MLYHAGNEMCDFVQSKRWHQYSAEAEDAGDVAPEAREGKRFVRLS